MLLIPITLEKMSLRSNLIIQCLSYPFLFKTICFLLGNQQKYGIYNFLDPKLSPNVKTDAPCMDSYETNNLISGNFLSKARGFVAYSHIKPPIDVEFKLICPIDVHYIKIHSVVGSQRTSGITVLVGDEKSLVEVGQASYEEDGVIFCNLRYHTSRNLPDNPHKYSIRYLRNNCRYAFTKCTKIVIRIFKTRRTVPCLAGVEIWGTVARSCPLVTINSIHCLMNKTEVEKETKVDNVKQEVNFKVPDEFLDAITYDVMSLPMTLPSGHNVDQTTLEKCVNNDNTYGRQPCDPFTGLKFTPIRKPVFNTALKTRIDMFLIENSNREELFNVKRTLGRKRVYDNGDITNCNVKKFKSTRNYYNDNVQQCNDEILVKSSNETLSLDDAINKVLNSENFLRFTVDSVTTSASTAVATPPTTAAAAVAALDDNDLVMMKCCVLCKNSDENNIYIIPCEHLFCRSCLLKICETLKCNICDKEFLRADVKRFHI